MAKKYEKIQPYAIEILAASLLSVLLFMLCGNARVTAWIFTRKAGLTDAVIAATAISGVIFGAFFAALGTEFGKRLRLEKAAYEYAITFAFPLFALATTMIILFIVSNNSETILLTVSTFMLIYSLLNCFTMVKNVVDLVRVWQDVELARQTGSAARPPSSKNG